MFPSGKYMSCLCVALVEELVRLDYPGCFREHGELVFF
jgi:hypothetical protein